MNLPFVRRKHYEKLVDKLCDLERKFDILKANYDNTNELVSHLNKKWVEALQKCASLRDELNAAKELIEDLERKVI